MFVQTIHAPTEDGDAVRTQLDRWHRELAPGAEGWLGTTAGITPDHELVAVVRFTSATAAHRNSERSEQARWWEETASKLSGSATFHDYPQAELMGDGGSDDAGFVQVIEGRSRDIDRLVALEHELEDELSEGRPEILGGSYAWNADGEFVQTVYFTSEREAREGERLMENADQRGSGQYAEYLSLTSDVDYADLRNPWTWSPHQP